jgi:hypothetical protein
MRLRGSIRQFVHEESQAGGYGLKRGARSSYDLPMALIFTLVLGHGDRNCLGKKHDCVQWAVVPTMAEH